MSVRPGTGLIKNWLQIFNSPPLPAKLERGNRRNNSLFFLLFCFFLFTQSFSISPKEKSHCFFKFGLGMSTAKVVCLSPSSVAQDWVDRSVKMQTRSTSLSFPSEVRDLTSSSLMNIRESISSVSVDKTFSLGSQRDNRSSPVTTSTQLSGGSDGTVHKCRQLPCRTFVSTGSCPYGDRCVFLHDISIMSKPVFIKIRVSSFLSCTSTAACI